MEEGEDVEEGRGEEAHERGGTFQRVKGGCIFPLSQLLARGEWERAPVKEGKGVKDRLRRNEPWLECKGKTRRAENTISQRGRGSEGRNDWTRRIVAKERKEESATKRGNEELRRKRGGDGKGKVSQERKEIKRKREERQEEERKAKTGIEEEGREKRGESERRKREAGGKEESKKEGRTEVLGKRAEKVKERGRGKNIAEKGKVTEKRKRKMKEKKEYERQEKRIG